MRFKWMILGVLCLPLLPGCGGGGGSSNTPATNTGNNGNNNNTGNTPGTITGGTTNVGGTTFGPGSGTINTGTGSQQTPPAAVTRVTLAPANPALTVNQTLTMTAAGLDANSLPIVVPSTNWTWTSSDGSVLGLNSSGDHAVIAGRKVGTAILTAKEGSSGITAQISITVAAQTTSGGTVTPGAGNVTPGGGSGTPSGGSPSPGTGTTPPATGVIYNNDFTQTIGSEWSNTKTETTPGSAAHLATRFLGRFGNEPVSLTLTTPATHTTATVEFDLFIIQSWDGNTTSPGQPQTGLPLGLWELNVDGGPTVLHATFSNITAGFDSRFPLGFYQSYPDNYPAGNHPFQTGAAEVNTLGYTFGGATPDDAVYHMKYTFAHTTGTLKLNFVGLDGSALNDESWGLKNVKVTLNP